MRRQLYIYCTQINILKRMLNMKKMSSSKNILTSKNIMDFIKNNFSIVKDIILIIGIIGVMYLQGHYVTLEKFENNSKANVDAHQILIVTMASMDKTLALMGRNQSDISDLTSQVKIHTKLIDEAISQNKIDSEYNTLFKENSTRISEINGRLLNIESLNINKTLQECMVSRAQLDIRLKALEDHVSTKK